MNAQREAFEAFFADSRRGEGTRKRDLLLVRDLKCPDQYDQDYTQRHWWTWQKAWKAAMHESEQPTAAEPAGIWMYADAVKEKE